MRLLCIIDEYTREALAIRVERSIGAQVVIETLADVMLMRGVPDHIRSDNGPEFTAKALRAWLATVGANALHRAGWPLGDRLLRELQRPTAG